MDKEMIERCSDALLRAFFSRDIDDQVITVTSHDHHDLIIPIIKAMREPTGDMILAATGDSQVEIWESMIDAITGAE